MFDSTEYEKRMKSAIERFESELKKVRTGRAHPDMIAGVKVEAYGQFMPLSQVANISVNGGTMLQVTPFDPATLQAIAAAIRSDASLGLNPTDDGHVVRVPIPPLNEERRKEIVKQTAAKVEEAKVAIRSAREDARKELKSAELPEDVTKKAEKSVDELTKKYTDEIDKLFKQKSDEIMTI